MGIFRTGAIFQHQAGDAAGLAQVLRGLLRSDRSGLNAGHAGFVGPQGLSQVQNLEDRRAVGLAAIAVPPCRRRWGR